MNYMLSVIVATYNHERFIRKALDSILLQDFSYEFEILIGDDGSTDKTPEILKEYFKAYPDQIRLFLRKKNIGATHNIYDLVTHAKGKYLATLDGDDYWVYTKKIQTQVDFLETHSEFIGCTHYFSIVNENGKLAKLQRLSWVKQKNIFSLKDFDGILMPGQPSTFVRRNIFLHPQHDYSILYQAHPLISDRVSILIFLCQGKFFLFKETWSCYCKHGNNSQSITVQQYRCNSKNILEDFNLLLIMEKYALNTFNRRLNFQKMKHLLFAKAFLKELTDRNSNKILKYMYRNTQHSFLLILFLPISILTSLTFWIKYH